MTIECPQCKSKACKRNGYTRHGKQNHRCLECGRQFSLAIDLDANQNSNPGSTDQDYSIEVLVG